MKILFHPYEATIFVVALISDIACWVQVTISRLDLELRVEAYLEFCQTSMMKRFKKTVKVNCIRKTFCHGSLTRF